MKKVVIAVIIIVAMIAGVLVYSYREKSKDKVEYENSYENRIKVLMESYPSSIIVYGKDFSFRKPLAFRKIDVLNDENLRTSSEYKYNFLVFNDMDDDLPITGEEIKLIKEYVYEKNYSFFYIGKQHEKRFVEDGVFLSEYMMETSSGQGIFDVNGKKEEAEGFWQAEDRDILNRDENFLGDALIRVFVNTVIRYKEGLLQY